MISDITKWAVDNGAMAIALVFVGAVGWALLFGYKTWPGLLKLLMGRWRKHEKQQTEMVIEEKKTAVTVDQILVVMVESVKALRLIGSQFPLIKEGIDACCDTIEREVKKSMDDLLREQEKSRQAARKTNRG